MTRTGTPSSIAWVLVLLATLPVTALAASAGIEVQDAWASAGAPSGGEAALYMSVVNHGDTPDTLLRVRCPMAAWSTEPRVIDRGEGAPASRAVKSIPIPANATVKLAPGGPHIALLQLKEPLRSGERFSCTVAFGTGGTKEVVVTIAAGTESPAAGK